jgi:hypothetical protein
MDKLKCQFCDNEPDHYFIIILPGSRLIQTSELTSFFVRCKRHFTLPLGSTELTKEEFMKARDEFLSEQILES